MTKPKDWVTVAEAAVLVNRAPRTVYEWIQGGELATMVNADSVTVVLSKAVIRLEATKRRGRPRGIPTRRR